MGWIRVVPVERHQCTFPRVGRRPRFGVGSVWQCDCGAYYRYDGAIDGLWREIPAHEALPSGSGKRLVFVKKGS